MKKEELKPVTVTVERAELRKGKIIIVLNPGLLSGQEFAVNPYYNEGSKKNKLNLSRFVIEVTEKGGEITECSADYNGYHSTTGHTQITNTKEMFVCRFEKCLHEILTLKIEYVKEKDRMRKILEHNNWTEGQLKKLKAAISERIVEDRQKRLKKATESLIAWQNCLQKIVEETEFTNNK